jgi:hypothetical protein
MLAQEMGKDGEGTTVLTDENVDELIKKLKKFWKKFPTSWSCQVEQLPIAAPG